MKWKRTQQNLSKEMETEKSLAQKQIESLKIKLKEKN